MYAKTAKMPKNTKPNGQNTPNGGITVYKKRSFKIDMNCPENPNTNNTPSTAPNRAAKPAPAAPSGGLAGQRPRMGGTVRDRRIGERLTVEFNAVQLYHFFSNPFKGGMLCLVSSKSRASLLSS
jgi:hypothetical protein